MGKSTAPAWKDGSVPDLISVPWMWGSNRICTEMFVLLDPDEVRKTNRLLFFYANWKQGRTSLVNSADSIWEIRLSHLLGQLKARWTNKDIAWKVDKYPNYALKMNKSICHYEYDEQTRHRIHNTNHLRHHIYVYIYVLHYKIIKRIHI